LSNKERKVRKSSDVIIKNIDSNLFIIKQSGIIVICNRDR